MDKTEARIVANHRQKRDYSLSGETSSKTVNPITVMTLVHLPLMYEEYEMRAYDIKGAFLLAKVPPEVEIYARVTSLSTRMGLHTSDSISTCMG
jgi:hypothetical protein